MAGARLAAGEAVVLGDPTVADRPQATAATTAAAPVIKRSEFLEVMSARWWVKRRTATS
jgi:hypothetical protein